MKSKFVELTKSFANRKHLSKKVDIRFLDDLNRPRLYCEEPAIAARFASLVRQEAIDEWGRSTKVLLRGQTKNHPGMLPGIFRDPCITVDRKLLLKVESNFIRRSQKSLRQYSRFQRPFLGALLQHYGFRTAWLDVVDNLWGAIWFASNQLVPLNSEYRKIKPNDNETGWIYFLSPNAGSQPSCCIDLRLTHQALSLRPHTQHGWSIRGPKGDERNLENLIIAIVEFPINRKWELAGNLWSTNYLFPHKQIDDTLERLAKNDINNIARNIEEEFSAPVNTLGALYSIQNMT